MKIWAYFGLAGLLCYSVTFQAPAQIVWASKELELKMTPGREELNGAFTFTNSGESDVTITSVKPGCGCTTAALEKKVYSPGESGKIPVTFSVGDRVGAQVKKIVVRTDDPAAPVTTLTVSANIPKWVELQPRLLMWKPQDALEPKMLQVTFHDPDPVILTGAVSEIDGLSFKVETLEEGRRYAIKVQPGSPEGSTVAGVGSVVATKTVRKNRQ